MLTRTYIEAPLVDEKLAVRELWDRGVIGDQVAAWAWWFIGSVRFTPECGSEAIRLEESIYIAVYAI